MLLRGDCIEGELWHVVLSGPGIGDHIDDVAHVFLGLLKQASVRTKKK